MDNSDELKIEVFDDPKIFQSIYNEWLMLIDDCTSTIFSQPEWYYAWWETFGAESRLMFITARVNSRLVGVLPFCARSTGIKDFFSRYIEPVSGTFSDYYSPIIARGYESLILPKVFECISNAKQNNKIIIWPNILWENQFIEAFRDFSRKSNYRLKEKKTICYRMSFGKDYSSTEKLWKKSLRTDLRRQKRRLVQKGKLSLWIASSKEDVLKILPEFFDVYNSKWLSQKKPSYLSELPMQEYCYRIVENVWGKGLHFSTLKCDDLSISYHFGFKYDGWLYWYKPTYRIDFHTYSPSKLHISYLVHEGIKSGLKGVDFLQGDEFYKKQWAMETKETVSFIIGLEKYSLIYYWFSYAKPWLLNIIGKKYLKLKASFGTIFLNRENTQF